MAKNIKKIILNSFFVIPLLTTPNIYAASNPSGYSQEKDLTTKDTPIVESRASFVNHTDMGGSDYWSYSKRVIYNQSSPNFPSTKYYSEFNSKYDKWFAGTLYFEKSYWDASAGTYVTYYYGNIARQQ